MYNIFTTLLIVVVVRRRHCCHEMAMVLSLLSFSLFVLCYDFFTTLTMPEYHLNYFFNLEKKRKHEQLLRLLTHPSISFERWNFRNLNEMHNLKTNNIKDNLERNGK